MIYVFVLLECTKGPKTIIIPIITNVRDLPTKIMAWFAILG